MANQNEIVVALVHSWFARFEAPFREAALELSRLGEQRAAELRELYPTWDHKDQRQLDPAMHLYHFGASDFWGALDEAESIKETIISELKAE